MKRTALLAAALVAWAGTAAARDIVVSSKIDTEGGLLGNMMLLALKQAGLPVQDRLQLGATPIVRDAIASGQIDIYPEYTGNAAFVYNDASNPAWKNAAQAHARATELDGAHGIVWLTPAPANNTWAIAVRKDVADAAGLRTMSDLGRYVAGGGEIKLAASSEFVTSPAALPAFQATYGFTLRPEQLVQLSGGDTAATIAAAAQQTSGVNAAMVYGTDGGIAPAGLVVMADDKEVEPVYQPAPIVRAPVLEEHPEIAAVLEPVFSGLTLEVLQELNGRIQVGGEPAATVAEDYLMRSGLLK